MDKKATSILMTKKLLNKQEILEAISKAKTAVVLAHVNPDGDTLASMLALARMLEKAGLTRVDRVMHDKVPEIYKFFPDQDRVLSSYSEEDRKKILGVYRLNAEQRLELDPSSDEAYDLSFSCDCGSVDRLASGGAVWSNARYTCNIDHHLSNTLFADYNWVEAEATSTGQVVYNMIDAWNLKAEASLKTAWQEASNRACGDPPPRQLLTQIEIDRELAGLMYITLLTDTAGFRHANTNALAFRWAAQLVELGANPSELYSHLFNQMPLRTLQVIGAALAQIQIHELKSKNIKIAYTETSRALLERYSADDEHTDEIVDHVMRIASIDACLYLREARKAGYYKGSLRSANSRIDCAEIAAHLGGGGHARAAGFNTEAHSFEELRERVFALMPELCCK